MGGGVSTKEKRGKEGKGAREHRGGYSLFIYLFLHFSIFDLSSFSAKDCQLLHFSFQNSLKQTETPTNFCSSTFPYEVGPTIHPHHIKPFHPFFFYTTSFLSKRKNMSIIFSIRLKIYICNNKI